MLRDLCTALGAVSLAGALILAAVVIWASVQESCERQRQRRQLQHRCADHETLDANTAYLGYRCIVCGRRRELGVALHIASNRRTRRSA